MQLHPWNNRPCAHQKYSIAGHQPEATPSPPHPQHKSSTTILLTFTVNSKEICVCLSSHQNGIIFWAWQQLTKNTILLGPPLASIDRVPTVNMLLHCVFKSGYLSIGTWQLWPSKLAHVRAWKMKTKKFPPLRNNGSLLLNVYLMFLL